MNSLAEPKNATSSLKITNRSTHSSASTLSASLRNFGETFRRQGCRLVLASAIMGASVQAAGAVSLPLHYRGLIEMDHGSSIAGMPRHSRYWVDFTLDGSVVDTNHIAFENGLVNANGIHGITTVGKFPTPFLSLSFTADSSNGLNPVDLSGSTFAYADQGGSGADVRDVNQPPNPQAPPCNLNPCINEHINLAIRDLTPGAPVEVVWFNLYNSTFYDPLYATRQLLLDVSQPGDDFRFVDLFLNGPETLAEFKSYRTPDFKALVDPVMFEGPSGTLASGRFLSLEAVPGPLPVLGVGAALGWSRRLRRLQLRLRAKGGPLNHSPAPDPNHAGPS